jgi:hypothetical protein
MVFNIPVVGSDRLPKLRNVLAGLFSIQNVYKYTDHYPLDDEDKTKVGMGISLDRNEIMHKKYLYLRDIAFWNIRLKKLQMPPLQFAMDIGLTKTTHLRHILLHQ